LLKPPENLTVSITCPKVNWEQGLSDLKCLNQRFDV
jgi:hypothetical protein